MARFETRVDAEEIMKKATLTIYVTRSRQTRFRYWLMLTLCRLARAVSPLGRVDIIVGPTEEE